VFWELIYITRAFIRNQRNGNDERWQASFGKDHPKVAIRLNNLALVYKATNRLKEAEPLYKRVADIFEKSLGPEHPNVATALNNLAQLYQATNRLKEAEPLTQRALKIFENSLGPDHPSTVTARDNLEILVILKKAQESNK